MHIIIAVIVMVWVFMALKDLFIEHWPICLGILAPIIVGFLGGIKAGIGTLSIVIIIFVGIDLYKKHNDRSLSKYLYKNCSLCGYVKREYYGNLAPGYINRIFKTSYDDIVESFLRDCENYYINNSMNWILPAEEYIRKNVMADVLELMYLSYPALNYSHITSNEELIYKELIKKCESKEGKKEFINVKLQDSVVKKELRKINVPFSKYYCNAFKINDEHIENNGNFISEEISADDLL